MPTNPADRLATSTTTLPSPNHRSAPQGSAIDPRWWDDIAEHYATRPVADPEAFTRKIEITRALMAPEHRVLDIGCGTGSLVLRLADAAAEVHGLDLSSQMVAIANRKAKAASVANVQFSASPFDEHVPVDRGSLDGVCAYNLLHLVEDPTTALAQIFALLRPGGFFVSSTPCLKESFLPMGAIISVMRWLGKAPPVVGVLSKSKLVDQIAAAGFVGLEQPDVGAPSRTAFVVARKPE